MFQIKFLLIAALCSIGAVANAKIINCYFGTWANYRPGDGKFVSSDVDPNLCTHLSYSFFGISDAGEIRTLDSWLDMDLNSIQKAIDLKKINPKLRVLAVVGGWNEGSVKYSNMAADPNKRRTFVQSTLAFIQKYGFDGLDLDWEYPAQRQGAANDKQNFVTLLKELKEAFAPHNFDLGIAVGASEKTAVISYDIPNIAKYVDFINVMTYDLGMAGDGVLGFNAPLRGQGQNNVETCIKYWLNNGAPASKLILGLAFYGRTFQLANTQQTAPGSASAGPGAPGPFTREAGYLGYNEICTDLSSWTSVFDDAHGVPYMYKGNQWVGYDNVKSIDMKLDFMNSLNLGGAMLWSIETDDFRGKCGEKYPLLNAINRKVKNPGSQPNPTTKPPVTTTTKPAGNPTTTTRKPVVNPTTSAPITNPPSGSGCSTDGFFANEKDCSRFFRCAGGYRYDFDCPAGLKFDINVATCIFAADANCGY